MLSRHPVVVTRTGIPAPYALPVTPPITGSTTPVM